jgi:4-diphosphocytidyl-2-C-methyl-D-erythritol kinase
MPRWWAAPAKLNLYLHVVGRRDDGYHLLDSLAGFADIGDRVYAEPAASLSLKIEGPFAGDLADNDHRNLVWRAAEKLAALLGREAAAAITLEKNLPIASGIGGGSSDAAATLKALCDLWQATPNVQDLAALALSLGADVPVCLAERASYFGGTGEIIDAAPVLPRAGLVLVNPGIALPTISVFKARTGAFSPPSRFTAAPADAKALAALLAQRHNDLTDAALGLVPEIGSVLKHIDAQNALLARMSGSGATCFGLFESQTAAEAAAAKIRSEAPPRWWIAAGSLI